MALSDADRLRMGKAARERVLRDFDSVLVTRKFVNYLRSIGL